MMHYLSEQLISKVEVNIDDRIPVGDGDKRLTRETLLAHYSSQSLHFLRTLYPVRIGLPLDTSMVSRTR